MLKELRNNPRALALAVLVHVALIAALLVSLDWTHKPAPTAAVATVQATVVDETKVRAEQEKLNEAERRKQEEERQRLKKLEQEAQQAREQERQRLKQLEQETDKARRERAQEQQRLAELEAQSKAEQKRQAERLAQEKAEQKRLADLAAKHKIDEEKKRQEDQARREQQLKNQLAAEEQAAVQQAREGEDQRIIAQYISLIEQKVKRNWHKPASATAGMECTVRVRLLPGGEVSDARVVVSSGDEFFDRSVESAVYRASPLPLPPDAVLFDKYFRDLNFIFRP